MRRKRKQDLSFPKGTGGMRGPSPQTGTAFAFKLASCWKGRATPSGMVQVTRPAELEGGAGRQGQGQSPRSRRHGPCRGRAGRTAGRQFEECYETLEKNNPFPCFASLSHPSFSATVLPLEQVSYMRRHARGAKAKAEATLAHPAENKKGRCSDRPFSGKNSNEHWDVLFLPRMRPQPYPQASDPASLLR